MSKAEMTSLFTANGLSVKKCETTEMQQKLKSWLALTKTPESIQRDITKRMQADISGKEKTGFSPYMEDEDIFFNKKWVLIVGKKQ